MDVVRERPPAGARASPQPRRGGHPGQAAAPRRDRGGHRRALAGGVLRGRGARPGRAGRAPIRLGALAALRAACVLPRGDVDGPRRGAGRRAGGARGPRGPGARRPRPAAPAARAPPARAPPPPPPPAPAGGPAACPAAGNILEAHVASRGGGVLRAGLQTELVAAGTASPRTPRACGRSRSPASSPCGGRRTGARRSPGTRGGSDRSGRSRSSAVVSDDAPGAPPRIVSSFAVDRRPAAAGRRAWVVAGGCR